MQLYSTNDHRYRVDLPTALFRSLPPDNGLYMPLVIPKLEKAWLDHLSEYTFQEIAFTVARALLQDALPAAALQKIVEEAISFPAPVVPLTAQIRVLELFHGPSLAFKDFGARFMSRLMHYFLQLQQKELHILVATSGDTGGAVALGFLGVPGIKVTILYPAGKVSALQEKQLTTLGQNITALEVQGNFDDCQRLVRQAFLDKDLNARFHLSSANSINIARLIPQTFYYFQAYAQLENKQAPVFFSVPSGNFGNLTAGLIAQRMGLPVHQFVASTNCNDVVPQYLSTGLFRPRPSLPTISNAMDVGHPSNFVRMQELFAHDVVQMRQAVAGYAFTDEETRAAIWEMYDRLQYLMCPHTAVAYLGLKTHLQKLGLSDYNGIFLSTAHPCKFLDVYEPVMAEKVMVPPQLEQLMHRPKQAVNLPNDYLALKTYLIQQH